MDLQPLKIGLDERMVKWWPEITYAIRTLMKIAGFSQEFILVKEAETRKEFDLYYGYSPQKVKTRVFIQASGIPFTSAPNLEPTEWNEAGEIPFLSFTENLGECYFNNSSLHITNDLLFSSFWLLTGGRETSYSRDRWDNLDLAGTFFFRNGLVKQPLVSRYGSFFRQFFGNLGHIPLEFPWITGHHQGAFVFSHDVDYPQILRLIESVRLLVTRGRKSFSSIMGVLQGTNHFWKFPEWVKFEKELNARSAFYFMARKGSLFQYARGIPDAFYDISQKQFSNLFQYLRNEGFEIGLHASYEAFKNSQTIVKEKERLEGLAGTSILGNRNHYWHLDPDAPHFSLRNQEKAGFLYDSSLAFEFYPGFRRGICHPFRPFHIGERRELDLVELPPTWMDDHFDRRLIKNQISDPSIYARDLVESVQTTGGIVVVDYHVRGMNNDFFPRYGSWLQNFIHSNYDVFQTMNFLSPGEVAKMFTAYEQTLIKSSEGFNPLEYRKRKENSERAPTTPSNFQNSIDIGTLTSGEEKAWDQFVDNHPQGTIYHSLSWKMVTQEGLGHTPYYLRALDSSGQIVGILPLFLVTGLYGRRLVSVPMRDRGGVVAQNDHIASQLVGQGIRLSQELNCRYLEMKMFQELPDELSRAHNLLLNNHWITTCLDLSPGPQNLWKTLDRKYLRWSIKKAEKNGLEFILDDTQEGIHQFFELFVKTRSSMGIPPFPQSLFRAIWQHLISKGKAQLCLVHKNSIPIHGLINFFSHDNFIPAYAAPQQEWKKYHGNEFLFWNAIKWACEQGFHYLDFGADSPKQEGLLWWKKKWGGVQHPMSTYHCLNGTDRLPNFDSSSPLYLLIRKFWRTLPICVGKSVGGWATKQLS